MANAEDQIFVTYDKLKINGELYELKLNGQQEELIKVERVQKNGEGGDRDSLSREGREVKDDLVECGGAGG